MVMCKPFSVAGLTGFKAAEVHLQGLPVFTAKDYGGYLPTRGPDSCLLMTLGILLLPWGWTPEAYYINAVQELTKPHISNNKVADYQLYAEQVATGKKIGLHAVVHMGLPTHVALLVVQCIQGEWMVILYTCGQPKCVCVAYIEDQHITPGTWGPPHAPRDWLSWSDFEPSWSQWRALHQQHTKVTHIGTILPVLNGFMFGDEPCGTLLGGESQGSADENSAEHWDDIMLGGDDQDATKSISGATALLLAGVPPETVQIIGRWTSNTFIGYQRYKAELMGGIANKMINTHYITAPVYHMEKGNQ